MANQHPGKCTKSTLATYAATRVDHRMNGEGLNSWIYRYANATPIVKRWVGCGIELGVHLGGEWNHRGRAYALGEIGRTTSGESYEYEIRGEAQAGTQVGFVVFGETLRALEIDAGGELRLPRDAGLVDTELSDLAIAIARGEVVDPRRVVIDYVKRHADVVSSSLTRAKRELEAHWESDLPIAMIAEVGGSSATSFTRGFLATYGVTPASYRVMLRVNAASRMLWMHPDMPTAEIGEACGFRSPSYFFRAYRRSFGLTPSESRVRFTAAA